MKRVIEIKKVGKDRIDIRLEATKRIRVWMKLQKTKFLLNKCSQYVCPLYNECNSISSPLKKYRNFGLFCDNLFSEYPDLIKRLEKFGVRNVNQVVPIKKNRKL